MRDAIEYIERYAECGFFQGSILIAEKGRILFNKGYGFARVEERLDNEAGTKFRIASISKSFTAAAILLLAEKGKLSLESRLSEYIPDYPEGDRITIHHLLCHSSGIPNYTSFPNFFFGMMRLPHTSAELIDSFKHKPLMFQPGESHAYSNSGYVLLAYIIEAVTGEPYEAYIKRNIIEPLGLLHTGFDDGIVPYSRAAGYHIRKSRVVAPHTDMSVARGGWAMFSKTEDLYLWNRALNEPGRLLSAESLRKMFTPYFPRYGGYGWDIRQVDVGGKSRKRIAHFGDIVGFVNYFCHFVEEDVVIAALSNTTITPVEHICQTIASLLFGDSVAPPQPVAFGKTEIPESVAGDYLVRDNESIRVTVEEGQLFFSPPEKDNWFVYPIHLVSRTSGEMHFAAEYVDNRIIFHMDSDGEAATVTYTDAEGTSTTAVRRSG